MDVLHLSRACVFTLANLLLLWALFLLVLPVPQQAVVYQLPRPQFHPLYHPLLCLRPRLLARPAPLPEVEVEGEEVFASLDQVLRTISGCALFAAIMGIARRGHASVMRTVIQSLLHPRPERMEYHLLERMIPIWGYVASRAIMGTVLLLHVGRCKLDCCSFRDTLFFHDHMQTRCQQENSSQFNLRFRRINSPSVF
jgi:hypothetical protein